MKWEIPDFTKPIRHKEFDFLEKSRDLPHFHEEFQDYSDEEFSNIIFEHKLAERFWFWTRNWAPLPDMDADISWNPDFDLQTWRPKSQRLLGYYIPYFILLQDYTKKFGLPKEHQHVLNYNDTLPKHAQFGIHLCQDNIINYIKRLNSSSISNKDYEKTALALLVQHVIGHEWGHYRAEVNVIQANIIFESLTGYKVDIRAYKQFKLKNKTTNFEEVFADYCGVKMGVFNTRYKSPITNSKYAEYKVTSLILSKTIFNNKNSPYGHLRYWMKDSKQMSNEVISLIKNPSHANRRVKVALNLSKADSPISSSLLDVLTHNQLQFLDSPKPGYIYSSVNSNLDFNQLESYWQFMAKDEFMQIPQKPQKNSLTIEQHGHDLVDILDKILEETYKTHASWKLPLKTFPDLLKIGPVLVH